MIKGALLSTQESFCYNLCICGECLNNFSPNWLQSMMSRLWKFCTKHYCCSVVFWFASLYPQCHLQSQLGLDNININLSKLITCTLGALTPQHRHFIMIFQCLLCKNLKHDEHSRRWLMWFMNFKNCLCMEMSCLFLLWSTDRFKWHHVLAIGNELRKKHKNKCIVNF